MSALFSPIKLRGLSLANRIMVAPMCQYSAENGEANDWHFTHINALALSGAAMFCIEATAVEAIGRITPGCLGLYNDATEAALKPILASVRRHSKTAVAMQLAHAGRKGSSHVPWNGGQQIPLTEGGWQTEGPSAVPHKQGEAPPLALDASGLVRVRDAFVAAARRHDVGGLGEERREEHRLGDAMADADDVQPRSETVDRQIEPADGDVQDAAGEDHDPAAFRVHHASDRRPRRDRRRRGDTEEKADLHLAGAELLQVAGQVQVEVEGEALQEVRGRREEERRRQQALARCERIRPLVVACGALRAGSCGCHCA